METVRSTFSDARILKSADGGMISVMRLTLEVKNNITELVYSFNSWNVIMEISFEFDGSLEQLWMSALDRLVDIDERERFLIGKNK